MILRRKVLYWVAQQKLCLILNKGRSREQRESRGMREATVADRSNVMRKTGTGKGKKDERDPRVIAEATWGQI